MQLISLVGFMGSGKDTAALHLKEQHGFVGMSFADSLKDAVAAIFCWDRELLDGKSKESRLWREQVDPWWASKMGVPGLTPRWVLQNFGTEAVRTHFHPDMWLLNVERRIHDLGQEAKVVITDCRFANELTFTHRLGGKVVRVRRGPEPDWYECAHIVNTVESKYWTTAHVEVIQGHNTVLRQVHSSEWAWIGNEIDYTVDNDGTLADLFAAMGNLVSE